MQTWPLRFRPIQDTLLFTDEAGGWFRAEDTFLERYATDALTEDDRVVLRAGGHSFDWEGDLAHSAYMRRWSGRHALPTDQINYVILVPTLRCNLSCGYCQVSRASEKATGYDWSPETAAAVISYLDSLSTDTLKVEFQGGEPLLRLDLLIKIRDFCRRRFKTTSFVVCSNFQSVSDDAWAFFDDEDTNLSTSIDGDVEVHTRQRTSDVVRTAAFLSNVTRFIDRFGPTRLSALPTVDVRTPPDLEALLETYTHFGISSIYLRPINQQGFARRKPPSHDDFTQWNRLHRQFIELLIDRNYESTIVLEEYYFTHALRRVLRSGMNSHVDLRNPNLLADSYIVVDFDGMLYPTDEARMMARVGQIDMSMGHVSRGIDRSRVRPLNAWSFNDLDPDCQHCAYQPYCGTDAVDDVSRHGRIDIPRPDTAFCNRHLGLFDLIFELIASIDPKVQHSLAKWAGIEQWPAHMASVHS